MSRKSHTDVNRFAACIFLIAAISYYRNGKPITGKEANYAMKGTDFFVGVLVGSIVGAAVGLLLAPQSGEETREVIGESARDIRDKVRDSSRQVVESSRDLIEQGKGRVSGIIRRGRETMEGGQEQAESA